MLHKLRINKVFFVFFALILAGCVSKTFDIKNERDPSKSFKFIKSLYSSAAYDEAIKYAKKFKVKYPYDKNFSSKIDLLIAESYFKKKAYIESAVAFKHFFQFYPGHPKGAYVLYKVGEIYWRQSPTEVDRELSFTRSALKEWKNLVQTFPKSSFSEKAKTFIEKGKLRILKSNRFVASFYCKQKLWHACAYRALKSIDENISNKEIRKDFLLLAANAFKNLAKIRSKSKKKPKTNLYFRDYSVEMLKQKAMDLQKKASQIKIN